MKKITLFDTSIATLNIGDEIIVDGVNKVLDEVMSDAMKFRVPTHERLGYSSYRILKQTPLGFVAGTNLLNSKHKLIRPNSWRFSFKDLFLVKNTEVILLGVGWGAYQSGPSKSVKKLYSKLLSDKYIHSVRDEYTEKKLLEIGIDNVLNTGCSTMWELTEQHCSMIPKGKSEDVVFTLTDYDKNKDLDLIFINILKENYRDVYFWPQGSKDFDYLSELEVKEVKMISPTLKAYDDLLTSNLSLDFIGTRLHGGIRALQKKRRAIIIGIDNRALEKKRDFNLQVVERENIELELETLLKSEFATKINLDIEKIDAWKAQFK